MDKLLHFLICFIVTISVTILRGWLPALISGAVIAFAKEIYDEAYYKGFDWKDIIADVAGIITGLMIGSIIRFVFI